MDLEEYAATAAAPWPAATVQADGMQVCVDGSALRLVHGGVSYQEGDVFTATERTWQSQSEPELRIQRVLDASPADTVLVFDSVLQAWVGVWHGERVKVATWAHFLDRAELLTLMFHGDGRAYDVLAPGATSDDGAQMLTLVRFALPGDMRQSGPTWMQLDVVGHRPSWVAGFEPSGVGEVRTSRNETPNPGESRRFGGADYDASDPASDQLERYRADYAVQIPEPGGHHVPRSGWWLNVHQWTTRVFRWMRQWRTVTLTVINRRGSLAVHKAALSPNRKPMARGPRL